MYAPHSRTFPGVPSHLHYQFLNTEGLAEPMMEGHTCQNKVGTNVCDLKDQRGFYLDLHMFECFPTPVTIKILG